MGHGELARLCVAEHCVTHTACRRGDSARGGLVRRQTVPHELSRLFASAAGGGRSLELDAAEDRFSAFGLEPYFQPIGDRDCVKSLDHGGGSGFCLGRDVEVLEHELVLQKDVEHAFAGLGIFRFSEVQLDAVGRGGAGSAVGRSGGRLLTGAAFLDAMVINEMATPSAPSTPDACTQGSSAAASLDEWWR